MLTSLPEQISGNKKLLHNNQKLVLTLEIKSQQQNTDVRVSKVAEELDLWLFDAPAPPEVDLQRCERATSPSSQGPFKGRCQRYQIQH